MWFAPIADWPPSTNLAATTDALSPSSTTLRTSVKSDTARGPVPVIPKTNTAVSLERVSVSVVASRAEPL